MLALVLWGNLMRAGGRLYRSNGFLRACQFAAPLGFVAVIAGWTTTEVGRQPWTVYGLMRTADSVSPSLTGTDVALSFLGYIVVYLIMFPAGFMLMSRVMKSAFAPAAQGPVESGRPDAPMIALPKAGPDEAGGAP
jgi:cytochrome d ubiquinol oxidase subunit I